MQQMNFLVRLTFGFAVLMIVIGVFAYVTADAENQSITALIPAFFGIPLLGAGYAATRADIGRYGGMAAAGLVVLLALGSVPGVFALIGALGNSEEAVSTGMIVRTLVTVLAVGYLVLVGQHMRERAKQGKAEAAG